MKTNLIRQVVRKFTDVLKLSNWRVLSNTGFVDVKTINKTIKYAEYKIKTNTGRKLICADTHILIRPNGTEIYAKDSLGETVQTQDGPEIIIAVEQTGRRGNMYDLELSNESNHVYYTNGILSHNTTTYTIYALWLCMFHNEKRIMLLANKADTVTEIMSRIQLAYEYLPNFLKVAVVTWNKQEIIFSNKSAIKGFATASDAARGYSANCVDGKTKVTIRFKWLPFLHFKIPISWLRILSKRSK